MPPPAWIVNQGLTRMTVENPPVNPASRECTRMKPASQTASTVPQEHTKTEPANQNACLVPRGPIRMSTDRTSVRCVIPEHSSGRVDRTSASTAPQACIRTPPVRPTVSGAPRAITRTRLGPLSVKCVPPINVCIQIMQAYNNSAQTQNKRIKIGRGRMNQTQWNGV